MLLRNLAFAGVLTLALASAAQAQPPMGGRRGPPPGADQGGPGGERDPRGGFFISPAGEPFRGGDGLAAWFKGADADHDGALTLEEFRADALRFFKVVDANGDGQIDGFETGTYERQIAPEINMLSGVLSGRRGMNDDDSGFGGGEGSQPQPKRKAQPYAVARHALLNTPQPVRAADEDLNGRVTTEEWRRAAAKRFALLDKAKTGKLTLDELAGPPKK